ncbi:Acylamidase [Geodia barretti]|uniref:Acylamidase n=1 Tax=Geodia barretti TaxID=519541 RepID=A0AA35W2P7_GEOBA|nr:Acylamidase [Geodia barretti]
MPPPAPSSSDLCDCTARELAALVRRRQVSAREVTTAHLRRIEQVNPGLNAIVTLLPERALAEADATDAALAHGQNPGPLCGLPVAHKDLFVTAGIRTTFGSLAFEHHVPDETALIVERERRAGAITLGKTNTPEFGAGSQTFNAVFGATRNPWQRSGRIAPQPGQLLQRGRIPLVSRSCPPLAQRGALVPFDIHGPMARTVADVALVFDAIAGPDARAPLSLGITPGTTAGRLERDFSGTRIGWTADLGTLPVEPAVTAVFSSRRATFEDLGCITDDDWPDLSGADEVFTTWRAWFYDLAFGAVLDRHRPLLKDTVVWNIEAGRELGGAHIAAAERARAALYDRVRRFLETHEFLVLPVAQVAPFPVELPYVTAINGQPLPTYLDWMKSCCQISVTGLPAISVPGGFTAAGLPVGIQIVGRPYDDLGVLQLAHAFDAGHRLLATAPPDPAGALIPDRPGVAASLPGRRTGIGCREVIQRSRCAARIRMSDVPGARGTEATMSTRLNRAFGVAGVAVLLAAGLAWVGAGAGAQVALDADDIGGVVRGANGPEAGVWVIAETDELDTRFRKIVVTDDAGRYTLPDLPPARYDVWVRGYGLTDSAPVTARPGATVDLQAVVAATPREAAAVYPANYWYSLVEVPPESAFPGTGENGNGISPGMRTQAAWIDGLKQGCQLCHQLGNQTTREILNPGDFDSTEAAWAHRVRVGQRGSRMNGGLRRFGADRAVAMYADWTDRIMAGEVPEAPPRPQGQERNVVLTMWEWGGETGYVHDEIATDKRNPQVNAGGPVYGVEFANDKLVWVDPRTNAARAIQIPVRDTPGEGDFRSYIDRENLEPSLYWGDELIWDNPGNPHNPMMDGQGRIWMTHQIRGPGNPAWCQEGSDNRFAQHYPLSRAARHVAYYDPADDDVTLIDTCFNTHHLQFGYEDSERLYLSSVGPVIGWLDVDLFEETGDAQAAQGWCPVIVDTNGDGRISDWVGRGDALDPTRDKEMGAGWYGIVPDPTERSVVWAASGGVPGQIVRLDWATTRPKPASPRVFPPRHRHHDRRHRLDRALGQRPLASFDRSKCDVLNGPTATGQHCPQGWSLYATPGPQMKGVTSHGSADFHYYNWVDQHNTLGLGENVPIATGSTSDSLLAFLPDTEDYVILRVPYPLGFYSRGMDGTYRRPGRRLEGARGLGRLRHQRGLALGRRQGHAGEPGEIPDSPRSPRALEVCHPTGDIAEHGPKGRALPGRVVVHGLAAFGLTMSSAAAADPTAHVAGDLALVLVGGGARAAYQVGFLHALIKQHPDLQFPIITGTSAGAINAAYLAAQSGPLTAAIDGLAQLWRQQRVDHVFRVDNRSLVNHVLRWGMKLVSGGGSLAPQVEGFLDTAPLRQFLHDCFTPADSGEIPGIARNIAACRLRALAITTTRYDSGQSVIWVQGADIEDWERPNRHGRKARITVEHIMASAALPLFFPAVRLDDGCSSARCCWTISIGTSGTLRRLNRLVRRLPPGQREGLRPVELVVIRPSRDLGDLTREFEPRLPRLFRHLTRSLGSREMASQDLLSLLMFQEDYIDRLLAIGAADAARDADRVAALLAGTHEP